MAIMQAGQFRKIVYSHYKQYGRHFPWRSTKDPYHIFVSEIMLQQTQAPRVVEKYIIFIKTFPDIKTLAQATTRQLYQVWSGLGYNRRALALRTAANIIVAKHSSKIPSDEADLLSLPGIGPYTAAAIRAFAFNKPSVVIETNIRTAYIYHFFKNKKRVDDTSLIPLIEKTMDRRNPRRWYSALMDYGAMLKKEHGNFSRQSKHHTKQSAFKDSRRQLRGALLKLLAQNKTMTAQTLAKHLKKPVPIVQSTLHALHDEGFLTMHKKAYRLS